jgi:hypothetical protein
LTDVDHALALAARLEHEGAHALDTREAATPVDLF